MKNDYEIRGETTVIFIKRRNGDVYEVLIDTDDLPKLIEVGGSWCVDLPYKPKDLARKPYAIKNTAKDGGGREYVKLHRFLVNAPTDKVVDHKDGNTLNNKKDNLRITDLYGNAQNIQEPSRNNKSGELNVYYNNYDGIWIASVMRKGKTIRAKRKNYIDAVEVAKQLRDGTYTARKRGRPKCS